VALNLADLPAEAVVRGSVLTNAEGLAPATMFEGQLTLLGRRSSPLKDYAEVHLHVGTAEAMAHVALLVGKHLEAGQSMAVQFRLASPLAVAPGERFVIRGPVADGRLATLGGGRILGSSNIRLRRNRVWTLENLARRHAALDQPARWAATVLREADGPLSPAALASRCLQPPAQAAALVDELCARGEAVRLGNGEIVHRDVAAAAGEQIEQALKAFHDANPMRDGLEPGELLAAAEVTGELGALALQNLLAANKAQRRGEVVRLVGRGAKVSSEEDRLCERVLTALTEAHLEPPLPADLAATLGLPEARLERIVQLLADRGEVVRLDRKVVMHRQAVTAAVEVVRQLFAGQDSFETVEFRDKLGVSRKFAVPLLDYFDTQRLTVRSGNRRRRGAKLGK
jgi:selenocysteine-specific elongation factor